MHAGQAELAQRTRRQLFEDCGIGVGKLALTSLLVGDSLFAAQPDGSRGTHHTPRAKSVIYLFMAGAPSQFELFEPKPELQRLTGQTLPPSILEGKRFAFMESFAKRPPKLLGTRREFARHGDSGRWVSQCLPHTAQVVDDLAFVRTVHTENFNHAPAKIFMNTGTPFFGRPSMGAWVSYGIGSEAKDLPNFVVLQSGPRGPRGGAMNWTSGFLPTAHQGVPFLGGGAPILNMRSPQGFEGGNQAATVDAITDLNRMNMARIGDPEISTRIAAYEMAHRMQTSGPELIDFSKESQSTLDLYGAKPGEKSFANNCLLARRLVERGVRFVQLYHSSWDHHGGPGESLEKDLDEVCLSADQACKGPGHGSQAARDARGHACRLGRRVRPHADGRSPRHRRAQPPYRRLHDVVRGRRDEAGPGCRRDGRDRILGSQGACSRPRRAGNHPAPAGHRPHPAHVPFPGTGLPTD